MTSNGILSVSNGRAALKGRVRHFKRYVSRCFWLVLEQMCAFVKPVEVRVIGTSGNEMCGNTKILRGKGNKFVQSGK